MLIGCCRVPSVRSAQSFATAVIPSGSTYGTLLWVRRSLAFVWLSDSHALNVPFSPAASASPWHFASAPASPPRLPLYLALLKNTVLYGSVRVTLSASPAACGSAQPSVG